MEIQDTLSRNPSVSFMFLRITGLGDSPTCTQTTRTLRIFVSHTVSGQSWQAGTESDNLTHSETGENIPAWQLKIEGRLLEARIFLMFLQVHTKTLC